ncbi:MAG: ligase-associated damage response endonuclease PdeM [Pseudomonadota bacterium]|nr:ligase-associated DNA damage response endonuclease PdeM [Betaproteobacteria bacterium]
MNPLAVDVGGHGLELWPQKAVYLPSEQALLVADVHLGKAQAFRRLGVPVPGGTTQHNLHTLETLLAHTGAQQLVFLGDLLHAPQSHSAALLEALQHWRSRHSQVSMALVRGNHDRRAGDLPAHVGIDLVDEPWPLGPWALCHHPQSVQGRYALAGHVHPAVHVGRGPDRLRLPCFHLGAQAGVLPAFGDFTGAHAVQPQEGDRVFVVAEETVREWPVSPRARR